MTRYGIPKSPALRTTSRIRVWWLLMVWGYKLLEVRRRPRSGWFSRLSYDKTYTLMPKRGQNEEI